MADKKNVHPDCFGILDTVFPKGEEGMRTSPEVCFSCLFKTDCLKQAMNSRDGLKILEENIDRAYESGIISFIERWSKKKLIHRKIKRETDVLDDAIQ